MDQKTSSILKTTDQGINTKGQFQLPTWSIIVFLIIFLVVAKGFIYMKDSKRHGK